MRTDYADDKKREIVQLLRRGEPLTVAQIAESIGAGYTNVVQYLIALEDTILLAEDDYGNITLFKEVAP